MSIFTHEALATSLAVPACSTRSLRCARRFSRTALAFWTRGRAQPAVGGVPLRGGADGATPDVRAEVQLGAARQRDARAACKLDLAERDVEGAAPLLALQQVGVRAVVLARHEVVHHQEALELLAANVCEQCGLPGAQAPVVRDEARVVHLCGEQ
eukprot:scaffold106786_cov63-Phaeocystis_antarctica.AAC.3